MTGVARPLMTCKRRPARAAARRLGICVALLLAACRAPAPPTLAAAVASRGDARARAQAFLQVAVAGAAEERPRAALLWGLYACEVPSPLAAVRAFARAQPEGGLARLAARRLEGALAVGPAAPEVWLAAAGSPWLAPEVRARLALRGAEVFSHPQALAHFQSAAIVFPCMREGQANALLIG